MTVQIRRFAGLGLLLIAAFIPGCLKSPPRVVSAEGTIRVNDEPLPFVLVEFVPQLPDYGAEMNSYGETDENGHFMLMCNYKQQPGAVVAKHQVVLKEKMPAELRGQRAQKKAMEYVAKLKNRPIPPPTSGRLEVEVKDGQSTYDINLTRPGK